MHATKSLVIVVITLVVMVSVMAATMHLIPVSSGLTSGAKHCRTNDPGVAFRTDMTPFTKAEVEQEINAHPFLTTSGKPAMVNEIVLVTSEDASLLMKGEYVGVPDNALVWYVQFCGPFLQRNGPYGYTPVTYPLGEEVFDAQSGWKLLWGMRGL